VTKNALLILSSLVITLALLEGVFRLGAIDLRFVRSALFYQEADLDVHQCSSDPFLHYELKPGASMQGIRPGGVPTRITIDERGARYPSHAVRKEPGTFRILCFGGSTMYGAGVNDDETIAAALEARLNRLSAEDHSAAPRRYEVWNFGTSAYTLGQAAYLARHQLAVLNPDLIVVQLHNVGRRPFLPVRVCDDIDLAMQTDGVSDFFLEQFPAPDFLSDDSHRALVVHSALYRALVTLLVRSPDGAPCPYCDRLSDEQARLLLRAAHDRAVPVLFVAVPNDGGAIPASAYPELPPSQFIDLYRPNREPEFYEIHPPAATLDEYAALLIDSMRARGFLPLNDPLRR